MVYQQAAAAIARAYNATIRDLTETIPIDAVAHVAELLFEVTHAGHSIYVFGNGGSAATADHMSCDLTKNTRVPGAPAVRCISLASAMAAFSAFGNDEGYDQVFAGPLRALGRPGDLALAISASGNSPNVLEALRVARELRMHTAALLGFAGGHAFALADVPVLVASNSVPHIEDAHLMINHMLTECVRTLLQQHV
ncbi:MAG TPA: SIS domain-containing protein [Chloroflexota bacterium]|nr:SIS domain-containing protein [Chloroflexota bacterium]